MTRPLALELPLHGRQWIEASAGTGKTFTLSLLVLRLLLQREIPLPNILTVTFTKPATEELKIKIRAQIKIARDLLTRGLPDDLHALDADSRVTALLLHEIAGEQPVTHLRQLLDIAMQDCDRASIFTIHGFCTRVLNDHALSAGQVLQKPELLTNSRVLNEKISADLWRQFSADPDLVRSLLRLWPDPESLARQSDALLQTETLLPLPVAEASEVFDMQPRDRELRTAIEMHLAEARELMQEASRAGILNQTSYKPGLVAAAFASLEQWHASNAGFVPDDPAFGRLAADCVKTTRKFNEREPRSPLFEAVANWCLARRQAKKIQHARDIRCLHLVQQRLRERHRVMLQKWQQYTYDDLVNQVAQALDGESGPALCQALRKDYPVALVDEFQDTDGQQWKIFSRLYPENLPSHALYLIGDPKQAIYGFRGGDVHAYLAAKSQSRQQWNLPENFRSRPSLLGAVATMFGHAGENAFRESGIRFYPVHSGGNVQETDCLLDGRPMHAMQLALLPEYWDPKTQQAKAAPAGRSRAQAMRACVEKIHGMLTAGQQNRLRMKDRKSNSPDKFRAVQAKDIAVLVNTNAEAAGMQSALSSCGIASVISSQESLFTTNEAREIFIVLNALVRHQHQPHWRGALSTVLLGYHAGQILALDTDDTAATESADLLAQYRELWSRQGVLALLSRICATAAPRILRLTDGERRLSNYLQLAEALQQAGTSATAPEQCLHWLGRMMQDDAVDEESMLRLDSDQKRVKIMTLHKSKGLEFPFVFMPFASAGKTQRNTGGSLRLFHYHEQHQRLTYAVVAEDDKAGIDAVKAAAAEELLAEQVRLLYVGLTRAQYYCWVCCGPVKMANTSGLSSLWFSNDKGEVKTPGHDAFLDRIQAIAEDNPDIVIEKIAGQYDTLPVFLDKASAVPIQITQPSAGLQLDWRVLSFSQLTHGGHYQNPSMQAAADEMAVPGNLSLAEEEPFDRRFSGIAFGNALHHVLEKTAAASWREHGDPGVPPIAELPLLQQALLRQGYSEPELLAGVAQLTPLVFNTLRTVLPEEIRLCDLPEKARLNEMEFHFSLRPCESAALLELLRQHGMLLQRDDFSVAKRLNGLMTGKVDLIYQSGGRFYVCDYKSNRLQNYDAGTCLQAMRDSEYDFQALIYTLALHRWCKFRLNENYHYDRHIGGIRYLFCRGLAADQNAGAGLVAMRFDRALIDALELLLHPAQESRA